MNAKLESEALSCEFQVSISQKTTVSLHLL